MEYWLVAGLAAYLLGVSKGGIPMISMLSVPLMALYMDPATAAGLLLPLYLLADCYAVYLFRKAFSVENLRILLPGAAIGVLVGYLSVAVVSSDAIKLLVAGIGFAYCFNALRAHLAQGEIPRRPANVPLGLFWGALAGLTSYISHAGGPPYQAYILPQRLDKMVYLGTTTIFFNVVNLMKLPPYLLAGQVTAGSFSQAIWLAPVVLIGAWSGATLARLMPQRLFFIVIEIALAAVSCKLLYEVIYG